MGITRLRGLGVVAAVLVAALLFGATAVAQGGMLLKTDYYLLSIGTIDLPMPSLVQSAQGQGFAVIVRDGGTMSAYRGTRATQESEDALLGADSLLYVDGATFLLRVKGQTIDYTVRPGESGYALVLDPHEDLPLAQTVGTILGALQQLGIVGSEVDMTFTSFAKGLEKDPEPPAGVAIDSGLYALCVAPDWFATAKAKGFTRVGLRVEVVAEKLPGASLPEAYSPYVESETDALAKVLLPIEKLVDLAQSSGVGYVRPPYQPHPAGS
jgi:hypothetical protein